MNGYIQAINPVDEEHLAEVMGVAAKIGKVELNAYFTSEEYYLLEGSHRIEAALRLQLPVILRLREWDDQIECDINDMEGIRMVGEIVDGITWSRAGAIYNEDQFVSVELA